MTGAVAGGEAAQEGREAGGRGCKAADQSAAAGGEPTGNAVRSDGRRSAHAAAELPPQPGKSCHPSLHLARVMCCSAALAGDMQVTSSFWMHMQHSLAAIVLKCWRN